MLSSRQWSSRMACIAIGLTLITSVSADFSQQYCASFNTASTNKNSSIYQSNGLCHDFCIAKYAFAVVQGDGCWCSNYAPSTTTSGCTDTCPGYPPELCGGSGVFGYVALPLAPSGTRGPAGATTPVALSTTPSPTKSVPTTSSSQITSNTALTVSSDPETSSTWTPTPIISLETITGLVRTVTVTPTTPPNSQNLSSLPKEGGGGGGGLGTGGAVGLTIGLVALAAIIGLMVWYYMRKKKQEQEDAFANLSRANSVTGQLGSSGGGVPSRTMSENSRYVLGTNGRQVVETWEPDSPTSRQNRLVPVDPRLDPFAPLYQSHNQSRDSINTLRDDQDYSRRVQQPRPVLRVNNPDTE